MEIGAQDNIKKTTLIYRKKKRYAMDMQFSHLY